MKETSDHRVTTLEALGALYGEPYGPAIVKEIDHINPHYRKFIEAAPFFALATCGPEGLDCSPRGVAPGFVRVADEKTLLIPDRRGNNRIDSLRNIVSDPRGTKRTYERCSGELSGREYNTESPMLHRAAERGMTAKVSRTRHPATTKRQQNWPGSARWIGWTNI